jgi:hypothetical protein
MSYDLATIERAAKAATPGPWRCEQSYSIGNGLHWCIVSEKDPGRAICVSMVTRHSRPDWFGVPCDKMPNQSYIAQMSPDCALALVRALRAARNLCETNAMIPVSTGEPPDEWWDALAKLREALDFITDNATEPQS